jgi:preprotein translocase subunit SecE
MARKPGSNPQAMKARAARTAAAMAQPAGAAAPQPPRRKTSPGQFVREVRAEARKITWTSRKETWITSVMVAIMVTLASLFFWGVDTFLRVGLSFILSLANAG